MNNHLLASAGPRIKKLGFCDRHHLSKLYVALTVKFHSLYEPLQTENTLDAGCTASSQPGLWHLFDLRVSESNNKMTSSSDTLVEMRQYTQCREEGKPSCMVERLHESFCSSGQLFSKAGKLIFFKKEQIKATKCGHDTIP